MHRRALLLTFAMAVVIALAGALAPGGARANGVPQLVKLTYLDSVSNWGPAKGEGVLEISFAEAYARVDVKSLPPVDGYTYEGWLVTPTGETLQVGSLTVTSAGVGGFQTKIANLTRYDYNLFVVAGRPNGAAVGPLPPQKSIAGRFTIIDDKPGTKPGETRPATLPNTGEAPSETVSLELRIAVTAAAMVLVAAIAWFVIRRMAKQKEKRA